MKKYFKSLTFALRGFKSVFKEEKNFRIEIILGAVVLIASLTLRLSRVDFIIIILLIGMVLMLEMMNTLLERFVDIAKPRLHHYVEVIKNVMAAIVLVGAVISTIIGILVFYPYISGFLLS